MKPCQNCGKPITSTSRGAKWCSNACRTIAYRKRNGIAAPDFLTTKRKAFLTPDEERELQRLQLEAANYEKIIKPLETKYSSWHTALLLFQTYGRKDGHGNYSIDHSNQGVEAMIAKEIGVAPGNEKNYPYRYIQVLQEIERQRGKISEMEKELLQRQRRALEIIDGAKARDEASKLVKKKNQNGVFTGADLVKMQFDVLPFDNPWKELIGAPARNFYGLVWGDAKAGKSYFSLSLAQYLTRFGKVAYFATEEGRHETMKKKVIDVRALNVQIEETRELTEIARIIAGVDFVFIDSANKIDLAPGDVAFLKETYPTTAFIVLLQSVKEGANFKGSQQWKHDCDFVIEVERPSENKTKATCAGRFGNGFIEYSY